MWIGIAIGFLFCVFLIALFVLFSVHYAKKFGNLGRSEVKEWVSRLLIHGKNHETLVFQMIDEDSFVQFKKYINSIDDFGVDLVFPLVKQNSGKEHLVSEICGELGLTLEMVKTKMGWSFAFIQMSSGSTIDDRAFNAAMELAEVDFSKNVSTANGGTFKFRRRQEVLGNERISDDDPSRYDIWMGEK